MKLFFLGTGAGMPSKQRNVTSMVFEILQERGSCWMFDCGEATQHQMMRTNIKPGKIDKVFISHLHGDHIFGLPGFLSSRSYLGGTSDLTVYGPKGISLFIETALKVSESHLSYNLNIVELSREGVIFEDEKFRVVAGRLKHRIECFGYRVEQMDLPGPLDAQKLQQEGIPPGPVYRDIVNGKFVLLPDGRTVNPVNYLGDPRKGKIVTILGDTKYCKESVDLAKNADVLVHEATFSGKHRELAEDYYHTTAVDAAKVAKEAGVKTLILNHISARYQEDEQQSLLSEAKQIHPHTFIASDFMEYGIGSP
jgi:ribonuclease Z